MRPLLCRARGYTVVVVGVFHVFHLAVHVYVLLYVCRCVVCVCVCVCVRVRGSICVCFVFVCVCVFRRMYMLGYLAKEGRVYLMDKSCAVASYNIPLAILEYQTAVVRKCVLFFSTAAGWRWDGFGCCA